MSKSFSLIKFQIGPVQDFIAAARSTRDLWSGSYLLSYLVAVGIKAILNDEPKSLIFPKAEGQPLLDAELGARNLEKRIPNLPNIFVARVPTEDAMGVAERAKAAMHKEWSDLSKSVWDVVPTALAFPNDTLTELKARFDAQVSRHLAISWQVTAEEGRGYATAYRENGWHLDAVRQTRCFPAWGEGARKIGAEKDSLTGKEEALCGGPGFADRMAKRGEEIPSLFKHDDRIGAITLIKRTWHIAHLGISTRDFPIRSTPEIANRNESSTDMENEIGYIAAIAFDGDSIGKWMEGLDLAPGTDLLNHHHEFSEALSKFALERAREIVEGSFLGQLIYAGGDDVVALVPADVAMQCANLLRDAFRECTAGIFDKDRKTPDASAGIAIAHVKSPLQDLIRAAQVAEKRAKNVVGRPAFSVALMKRSGEISHWGAKWESGGIQLSEKIAQLMNAEKLSAKFPHRVCQLLEPYITARTGFSQQGDLHGFDTQAIILQELSFAIQRQSDASASATDLRDLEDLAKTYLENTTQEFEKDRQLLPPPTSISLSQTLLTSIVGLCITTAFMHRQPNRKPAASQLESATH